MKAAAVQALTLAVIVSGCFLPPGTTSPSDVTPGTAAPTMEIFSGTLAVRGSSLSTFTVEQAGTVAVTISSVGPPPNIVVGLGLGTPNVTGACDFSTSNPAAVAASKPQITVTEPAGQYCIEIYDVGNLTGAVSFTLTIRHS